MAVLAEKDGVQKCFSANAWALAEQGDNPWVEVGVCDKNQPTFASVQGNNYKPPVFGGSTGPAETIIETVTVEVPVPTGITNLQVN